MQLFEGIEALKPDGITMSAFLTQLVEQGMKKLESYEERATREMHINAAVNQKQYDEMTKDDDKGAQDAFRLSHGTITFNEIIEKHAIELAKKYG